MTMKADFEGYPINAEINEVIHFMDLSSNDGPSYTLDWDFGDGSSHADSRTPTHSYFSPGIYTVKLTISANNQNNTMIKEKYITVRYNRLETGFVRDSGPTLIFD